MGGWIMTHDWSRRPAFHDLGLLGTVPAEQPQKQLATPEELTRPLIRDRRVLVSGIPLEAFRIRNKTFENCDIVGPCILMLMGHLEFIGITFDCGGIPGSSTDLESILWPKTNSVLSVGVIGLDGCIFHGGTTEAIGFTGSPEMLDLFRKSVTPKR
jgi:hypothetical protein